MSSPKDSARQPTYLYEMMQHLGIEPGEGAVPYHGLAYIAAFHRCQACRNKEACRDWLNIIPRSIATAPSFCPNDDILFELRFDQSGHPSVKVGQYAPIADLECLVDEIDDLLLKKAENDSLVAELKSRKARLCDEIEVLRGKPSQQACHLDVQLNYTVESAASHRRIEQGIGPLNIAAYNIPPRQHSMSSKSGV